MGNIIVEKDVEKIKVRIIELAKKVLRQHEMANESLTDKTGKLAQRILLNENDINEEALSIKNNLSFIFTKEPLAKYLRRSISYLIISKELERIADYAKHIAHFVENIIKPRLSSIRRIREIYETLIVMLKDLVKNIEIEDSEELEKLVNEDDLVDFKCKQVNKELVVSFSKKQHSRDGSHERLYILNLVHDLERAGDHVVNICESLYYIINGKHCKY